MNSRNIGKFRLSLIIIKENPEVVAQIFSILKIVPVRVECLFVSDAIEYTAIGERFVERPHGMIIPEYNLIITQAEDGHVELVEVVPI